MSIRSNVTATLTLAGALSCAAALGSPTPPASSPSSQDDLQAHFSAADKNHDGHLTLEEARDGMPRVARHFAEIDKERKGYLTIEDIRLTMEAHGH